MPALKSTEGGERPFKKSADSQRSYKPSAKHRGAGQEERQEHRYSSAQGRTRNFIAPGPGRGERNGVPGIDRVDVSCLVIHARCRLTHPKLPVRNKGQGGREHNTDERWNKMVPEHLLLFGLRLRQ